MITVQVLVLTSIMLLELVSTARADILEVPATAVVLPEDGSGIAKMGLLINLAGMRSGNGLTIQSAAVVWEIPSMPSNRKSAFNGYRMTGSWGILGPDALDVISALEEAPQASWQIHPQDIERSGRKIMKLMVTDLAQEILDLRGSSLSLLVTSSDLARSVMADNVAGVRLKIRYGFLGVMAPEFKRQE